MMRRVMRMTKWLLLVAGVCFLFTVALGGGKHDCVTHRHSLDWGRTCRRTTGGCAGGCYRLVWFERNCIPGSNPCTRTTNTVTRLMYRADCNIPSGPTCDCNTNWTLIGPWDEEKVPWCH